MPTEIKSMLGHVLYRSEKNTIREALAEAAARYADLRSADLAPLPEGWRLTIGCWFGTVAELRELIAGDDWPEATAEQITVRRPMLAALADMCDAWTAANPWALDEVRAKWGSADA